MTEIEIDKFYLNTLAVSTNADFKKDGYKIYVFISMSLFSFATRAGSPQQRESITVGPYKLTHPVNFPCERKS